MPDNATLRERIRNGETLHVGNAPMDATKDELAEILKQGPFDMIGVCSQHGPFNEEKLWLFCKNAHELGIPVQLRIKHPKHAYLIGNLCDLGPAAIVIPQVDDEADIDEAIRAFYYPPVGIRSFPPPNGYGTDKCLERDEYIEWWNENGILTFQLESVEAVVNARKLAKPGIAMLYFGAEDLKISIAAHPNSPFSTIEECKAYVRRQMEGTGIKVAKADAPSGEI